LISRARGEGEGFRLVVIVVLRREGKGGAISWGKRSKQKKTGDSSSPFPPHYWKEEKRIGIISSCAAERTGIWPGAWRRIDEKREGGGKGRTVLIAHLS